MAKKLYLRPYYKTPPIRDMTAQQFESWKNIARQEGRPIYLGNGLDVVPDGDMRIDYEISAKYDVERAYEILMIKLYELRNPNV